MERRLKYRPQGRVKSWSANEKALHRRQTIRAEAGSLTFESSKTDMHSLAEPRTCAHPSSYQSPIETQNSELIGHRRGEGARERADARAVGVLGTTAKYSSAPGQVDPETGEITYEEQEFDPVANRLERFALQSAARRILPNSRTAFCLRNVQKAKNVEVWQSAEHSTCSYKGLQTCGSVWACPCCSSKISERRRVELRTAMDLHTAAGGQVLLATFTTPHYLGDDLEKVLDGQAKALKYLNSGRAAVKFFEEMGCVGKIRALEVTHGRLRASNNGWHPHYHVLLFVRSGLDLTLWRVALSERWRSACVKAGLKAPDMSHGITLEDGSKAAAYASKWGLESEMTKGHTKKSNNGETPFDLLRAYLETGDKHASVLFREFAETFKGKRQLHWSKGLKQMFGIGEKSDEELAEKQDDVAAMLGTIPLEDWRKILRVDGRGLVLELAVHGWDAVRRFIDSIKDTPGHRDEIHRPIRNCKVSSG